MEIYEIPLPGIGVRYEFTAESGDHVGVVLRRDGKRDVALYDRHDPDACRGTMELSAGDASKLAELLGGTNITAHLDSLKHMVEGLAIEWITMPVAGGLTDKTNGDSHIRTATSASVVAATPHHAAVVLIELGVIFLLLAVLGRLDARIGIPSVPLYLLAGLVMGDGGLFKVEAGEELLAVGSQIGVVLLLLLLGLEYSPIDLKNGVRTSWRAGVLDVLANTVPGFALGLILGWPRVASLLLGGVTYVFSSGIIARLLDDFDRLANRETAAILSLLVMEDIAMAIFLPIVAVILVGASIIQGAAAAVGAFLLGLTLSGQVADEMRSLLPPLLDVFGGIFFVFFGLTIDPRDLVPVLLPALALAVVTGLTKIIAGAWAAAKAGIGPGGPWRTGLSLIARGEFSIVIAGLGVAAGVQAELGPLSAAYVLMLALTGSVLMRFADRIPVPRIIAGGPQAKPADTG